MSSDLSPRPEALREAAYEAQPTLNALDVELVLIPAVSRILDRYDGPDDQEVLTQWAISTIIQPGAALLHALNTLVGEHADAVRSGIRSVVKNCTDLGALTPADAEGIIAEVEMETWWKVFTNLDHWLAPSYSKTPGRSPAKLKTRLYALARLQAMGWRTEQLRRRAKFGTINEATAAEEKNAAPKTARKPSLSEIELAA